MREVTMLGRWVNKIFTGMAVLAGLIVGLMFVSVTVEVILRYLFNKPTGWMEDFASIGLLYMTFLAGAWVLMCDRHTKIEIVLVQLSANGQRILNIVTSLIGAAVTAILFWFSIDQTISSIKLDELALFSRLYPAWPFYVSTLIGSFFLSIGFILKAWLYYTQRTLDYKQRSLECS